MSYSWLTKKTDTSQENKDPMFDQLVFHGMSHFLFIFMAHLPCGQLVMLFMSTFLFQSWHGKSDNG